MQPVGPQNSVCERALIGACVEENALTAQIMSQLPSGAMERAFWARRRKRVRLMQANGLHEPFMGAPTNQEIWEVIQDLFLAGEPFDELALRDELSHLGRLEAIGGDTSIAGIVDEFWGGGGKIYLNAHVRVVIERWRERRTARICEWGSDQIRNVEVDTTEAILRVREEFAAIDSELHPPRAIPIGEALDRLVEETAGDRYGKGTPGVLTPWSVLNQLTTGWRPGNLVLIAGRPGAGKSVVLGMIAGHAAANGTPTLFLSLEMSVSEVTERLAAWWARIPFRKLREQRLNAEEKEALADAAEAGATIPLWIEDTGGLDVGALRTRITNAWQTIPGLGLVVVDYLQLIRGNAGRQKRYEEVGDISRTLKALAKNHEIPIIAGAQFGRAAEETARPKLSHLRESGDLEADADLVIAVHRVGDGRQTEFLILKNRHGPLQTEGQIKMTLDTERMIFA